MVFNLFTLSYSKQRHHVTRLATLSQLEFVEFVIRLFKSAIRV